MLTGLVRLNTVAPSILTWLRWVQTAESAGAISQPSTSNHDYKRPRSKAPTPMFQAHAVGPNNHCTGIPGPTTHGLGALPGMRTYREACVRELTFWVCAWNASHAKTRFGRNQDLLSHAKNKSYYCLQCLQGFILLRSLLRLRGARLQDNGAL